MLIEPLLASLFIGWLRGGSLMRLYEMNLAYPGVIIGALLARNLLPLIAMGPFARWRFLALVLIYLLLLAALAAGKASWGTAVASLGIFLNLVVIAANGAMPVSLAAAKTVGYKGVFGAAVFADGLHRALTPSTRLAWLSDTIAYAAPPPLRSVISIGDLFLAVGVFILVQENMAYRGKHLKKPA